MMARSFRFATPAFVVQFLGAVSGAGLVYAHGGASGIVKERMDLMKGIGEAMKRLTAMFKGEIDYNADVVREAARTIHARAGDHITRLFPEGSLDKPTEAFPTLGGVGPAFEGYASDLETYSAVLKGAAGNGFGPMHDGGVGQGQGMMGRGPMMGRADARITQ